MIESSGKSIITRCCRNAGSDGTITVLEDGVEKKLPMSIPDILVFTTGASEVPPMGFTECPSIAFKESGCDLPSASTCSNVLYMPTIHWNNYDMFKYKFVFAITCAVGFGQV